MLSDALTRTRLLTGCASVAALTALAACSGGSGGAGEDTSAATTATSTVTATTTGAAPGTESGTTSGTVPPATSGTSSPAPGQGSTGAAPARCAESQLRASIDPRPYTGTADRGKYVAYVVDFRNTSSAACTISGYPGVALLDSNGTQAKQATRTLRGAKLGLPTGRTTVPSVTLQPGAYASAGLEGVNQQETGAAQAGCDQPYSKVLITPPNTRTPVPFDLSWPRCYSVTVHPTNLEQNPPS